MRSRRVDKHHHPDRHRLLLAREREDGRQALAAGERALDRRVLTLLNNNETAFGLKGNNVA